MKKQKKVIAVMILAIIILGVMSNLCKVYAETGTTAGTVTFSSNVAANQITMTRYVNDTAANVTNTFGYTITADASNPANGVTNAPTTASIVFNDVAPGNDNVAVQTGTIDFAGTTFTKVGDYRFTVAETSSTDSTVYPLDSQTYTIVVQVKNELDANDVPTGNLIATLVSQAEYTVSGTDHKGDIKFESDEPPTSFTISKSVTGDLADKDEYFEFCLLIDGLTGATYTVTGAHSTDGTNTVNSSTYTVDSTDTIYLKHGQTVTISNVPEGTEYDIEEQGAVNYETYIDGSSTDSKSAPTKKVTSANTNDNTSFVNNYEQVTLTGVFINVAPYIIVVAIAVLGIIFIRKTSRND